MAFAFWCSLDRAPNLLAIDIHHLAALSQQAHEAMAVGDPSAAPSALLRANTARVREIEAEIDRLVA